MAAELLRAGLTPGCEAPDFDLPSTDGSRARLRDLQGQPVLLHLVSYTCPVTRGGMSTMRELHRLYGDRVRFVEMLGGLASAAYLIDGRGTVAFCGTWGQSPALRVAIDDLLARDGIGAPAGKGTDRRPHLAAAIVAGHPGPQRGGRQALIDLELGFPGANILMGLGRAGRPLLAPLALRTTPLPIGARVALLAGIGAVAAAIGFALRRLRPPG
ncbi:MAG: peroxiredoxin family protein [Actinomycetota bacterium]